MVIPFLLLLVLALGPGLASAQSACDTALRAPASLSGTRADYLRVGEITGIVPVLPRGLMRASSLTLPRRCVDGDTASGLWPAAAARGGRFAPAPARSLTTFTSDYPRDRNNGALWAGRGVASSLEAGVTYRHGGFAAALVPLATYSENRDFTTVATTREGFSPLAYPWHTVTIDWPQRPGEDATNALHPGQSYVRFDGAALSVGVSTENLWIGPARRNPVLMSNTAPGFPHLFAGTGAPLETGVGGFDAQLVVGALDESEHWDDDPDNDRRFLTAFSLVWLPRWVPGLQLGAARVYEEGLEPGGLPLDRIALNLVDVPFVATVPGDRGNEISSLFARWVFPDAGFEAYGEWAREEDPESLRDLLEEPGYTQGYMLGAQQVLDGDRLWWRLWAELTHLGPSTPVIRGRVDAPYYTSTVVGQGHTHQGQLLGAWIGPGSDTQALGIDLFHPFGLVGLYGERVRYDAAAYYQVWSRFYAEARYDAEITAGARASLVAGAFELSAHASWSERRDRNWVTLDGVNWEPFSEKNTVLELVLGWSP